VDLLEEALLSPRERSANGPDNSLVVEMQRLAPPEIIFWEVGVKVRLADFGPDEK
jgi:hypothetical protein